MLWVSSVMAAALGQERIKVRSCVIAAAARGVSMAVSAPITRKHAFQSFQEDSEQRLCHRDSRRHPYAVSRRGWGTCSGAGRCGAVFVLSQCERDLLSMRDQAGYLLANEERWGPKILIKYRPVVLCRGQVVQAAEVVCIFCGRESRAVLQMFTRECLPPGGKESRS